MKQERNNRAGAGPGTRAASALVLGAALMFSGCLNLKPVVDQNRTFVLTPLPGVTASTPAAKAGFAVGMGRVEIPDYLQPRRIALRQSDSEVEYFDTLLWAERLDKGLQRVLAANLNSLLGCSNAVWSGWRRRDVEAEVYVSVHRFETNPQGDVRLEASWRVTSPGAEKIWRSGRSGIAKRGPSFNANPEGAVAALSESLAELSGEIASAVRDELSSRSHR
jgi:uncharacterized protein